ncbi:hypothetical protein SFRURICE_003552 [Spodoptera frugiperda]|nr:hypothetical protein SFRURICE_003552 [Spodoptera frugiperda]
MIFPTTNTCSNTLPYRYDGHSWAEYAFYFVTMFWRRISMLGQFPLHKQGTSYKNHLSWSLCMPCSIGLVGRSNYMACTMTMTNDFYMKSLVYAEGIDRASKFFSKT